MKDTISNNHEDLEYSLIQLRHITKSIRIVSTLVMILFFIDILSSIFLALLVRTNVAAYRYIYVLIVCYSFSFFGLIMLHSFELLKKRGTTIYDLLMEQIEWSTRISTIKQEVTRKLYYKRILKEFIVQSDLPFVGGNYGKTIYFIMFVLILLFKVWITLL